MEGEWSEMSVFWRHPCCADFVRIFRILMEQKLFNLVSTMLALSHFQYTDPSKGPMVNGESSALILTGTTFIL